MKTSQVLNLIFLDKHKYLKKTCMGNLWYCLQYYTFSFNAFSCINQKTETARSLRFEAHFYFCILGGGRQICKH